MIERKLFAHLSTSATVAAVVGARIYPTILPQNPTLPAIAYVRTLTEPVCALGGYCNLENVKMQIDVYATSFEGMKAASTAVMIAMRTATAYQSIAINETDGYDEENRLYRGTIEYSLWNQE
jgi:hypothetical protein